MGDDFGGHQMVFREREQGGEIIGTSQSPRGVSAKFYRYTTKILCPTPQKIIIRGSLVSITEIKVQKSVSN